MHLKLTNKTSWISTKTFAQRSTPYLLLDSAFTLLPHASPPTELRCRPLTPRKKTPIHALIEKLDKMEKKAKKKIKKRKRKGKKDKKIKARRAF